MTHPTENIDRATVEGFGAEWQAFDQTRLTGEEYEAFFQAYFGIFPFADLPDNPVGFDLGCGSGRWAVGLIDRVGTLHCIDPSKRALEVAKRRLGDRPNVKFHVASVDAMPLADASQDFGYSLGVLHHVPNTQKALNDCVCKLKAGAPFLVYLYYKLDGRPAWFRALWRGTDAARKVIARLPFPLRKLVTTGIAGVVYWPLARGARIAERARMSVSNVPLSAYRNSSFYSMRTDALDRFGTRLEQRFSRDEIRQMMDVAGLTAIHFSEQPPFWVACGRKKSA
jgi:SAM-dependent methyltransferase